MKSKRKKSKELLLLNVRVLELRSLVWRLQYDVSYLNNICGRNFQRKDHALSSISFLKSEIELWINRYNKRSHKIVTDFIKDTGKTFQESPRDLIPFNKEDLLYGYIILNEVKNDSLVTNVYILETGEIIPKGNKKAQMILSQDMNYEDEYTRKKIISMNALT